MRSNLRRFTRGLLPATLLAISIGFATPVAAQTFIRGDVNESAMVNISDAILLLQILFLGEPAPVCESTQDANDDGSVDISDSLYVLAYLFTSGPVIPPPFPAPGIDPTPDSLFCGLVQGTITVDSATFVDNAIPVRIVVSGTTDTGSAVMIRDDASGYTFGSVAPDAGGAWTFQLDSPLFVPCDIRATSGTAIDTRGLTGFPSTSCGPPANFAPTVKITAPTGPIPVGSQPLFTAIAEDHEGGTLFYSWHFGGAVESSVQGLVQSGQVIIAQPIYEVGGQAQRVTLTVVDAAGLRGSDRVSVLVGSAPTDGGHPAVSERPQPGAPQNQTHAVFAVNDLGMHCADSRSVPFSILPPFNVLNAQVVERGNPPVLLDDTSVSLVYSAAANPTDVVVHDPATEPPSINSTSRNYPVGISADNAVIGKTDMWDDVMAGQTVVEALFGLAVPPDVGLPTVHNPGIGRAMPGELDAYVENVPKPFGLFRADTNWFTAEGIPITSVDDFGRMNAYPLFRVEALANGSGATLAAVDTVVPVSQEVDCRDCHRMGEVGANPVARPGVAFLPPWPFDPIQDEKAAKMNIMMLHDALHATSLVASAPVLCASCHNSYALEEATGGALAGDPLRSTMSGAMHGHHGLMVVDSQTGTLLRDASNDPLLPATLAPGQARLIGTDPLDPTVTMEDNCFTCHPGRVTQCFRGAMFDEGLKCSSCHGDMLATGGSTLGDFDHNGTLRGRLPWRDEPRCESCHQGDAEVPGEATMTLSLAYAMTDPAAVPLLAVNPRFAENLGELYRNSHGHGGLMCESCHGSPHAIWPNPDPRANDNVMSNQLQGHPGTVSDCFVCHTPDAWPDGTMSGPHGMHPVNDPNWIKSSGSFHEDWAENGPGDPCASCHGADHKGTRLSVTPVDRELRDASGNLLAVVKAGQKISCDLCHSLSESF